MGRARKKAAAAGLPAANVYAVKGLNPGVKAGTWVALDCGERGDCDGLGFWLGRRTKPGSYLASLATAEFQFKGGVTDIEVGGATDLQYFGRYNAEQPLEFEREPARETIHGESIRPPCS